MKLSALSALLLTPHFGLATPPQQLTPGELNAAIIGDGKGDHRTTPWVEGLPDPYRRFAEEADAMEVLGE
jgi:hypothetical protein